MATIQEQQATILFGEIQSIREKVNLRYSFNNAVLPLSLAGFAAFLGLSSEKLTLCWLIPFIPPCALVISSYSILQVAYIRWLETYLGAKSKALNILLGDTVIDYELTHSQSAEFSKYRRVSVVIIWGIWLILYLALLIYAVLQKEIAAFWFAYLCVNVLFLLLHLFSCYRIAFVLPKVARKEFIL